MAADKEISFSAREMEVLALAWQCMEAAPKIDMAKLARLTGYTQGSASVTFGNIKRKIKLLGESLSDNGPATPKKGGGPGRSKAGSGATPKSGNKRGAAGAGAGGASDTPSKRQKKGGRQAREQTEEQDEEEEAPASPIVKNEEREKSYDFLGQLPEFAGFGTGQVQTYGHGDIDNEDM